MSDEGPDQEHDDDPGTVTDHRGQRAYSSILNLIVANSMSEGDRLPAERVLAEQFGVSRTMVREALMRLAADGIITSRRGSGSFIRRRPSQYLMLQVPLEDIGTKLSTYEMRFALEGAAARLAAMRCSNEDAIALGSALDELKRSMLGHQPWQEKDIALHRAIIHASKNPVFTQVFELLNDSIFDIMSAGYAAGQQEDIGHLNRMFDEHAAIVEAIKAGDGDGAELAMRHHLYEGRKRLLR